MLQNCYCMCDHFVEALVTTGNINALSFYSDIGLAVSVMLIVSLFLSFDSDNILLSWLLMTKHMSSQGFTIFVSIA